MRSGGEFAFTFVGQFCRGCQHLVSPDDQLFLRQLPSVHIVAPGLIDGELNALDIVQIAEGIQRAEGVALELAVVFRFDQHAQTELEVDNVQQVIRDDHAVAGSEAVLHPLGEIQRLLHADQRVLAQRLGRFDLLHHEVPVALSGLLHLRVVPGQILSRIAARSPQRLLHQILAQLMGVGALLGIRTALVLFLGTELRAGRTLEPSFAGRRGEVSVFSHCRCPPPPPRWRRTPSGP